MVKVSEMIAADAEAMMRRATQPEDRERALFRLQVAMLRESQAQTELLAKILDAIGREGMK